MTVKFLSICSGIEAASVAAEPLGWRAAGFAEIERFPSAVLAHRYGSNMPGEPLSKNGIPNHGDFTKIAPRSIGQIDGLIGGTPCFTAGHLILSERGYTAIENIRPGDYVMTHKGRLRRVVCVGSKQAEVGEIKGVGIREHLVCTPDHPFLSVDFSVQNTRRNGAYARVEHCGEPVWTAAADMGGKQWASLVFFDPTVMAIPGRYDVATAMYVAGMYLGDGHIRRWADKSKKAIVLSLNEAKFDKLLSRVNGGTFTTTQERTSKRATISDTAFANWLIDNFGEHSHAKRIPSWVYGHPNRADLLHGYLDTDGHEMTSGYSVSTTSRTLAYGVAALLTAEGYPSSVSAIDVAPTTVIEGRTVNQREYWQVRAFKASVSRKSRIRHGYLLRKIDGFSLTGRDTVYNIEVDEDHSYVVQGTIVHNCQAFSIAGKRLSLDDDRGNLTLAFVVLAHELARSNGMQFALWENVPGVLSTKDNAFGCFLGAIVGADDALPRPAGKSWPSAGMVAGPRARAAWRVLDAQYFGLAQRRKRVFVVVSFGELDPAAVLFEPQSLHGNSPPRREKRKDLAPTIEACTRGRGGLGTDFECDGGLIEVAHGQGGAEILDDQCPTMTCNHEAPIVCGVMGEIAHTLTAEGADASEDGCGRGTPVIAIQAGAMRENTARGPDGVGVQEGIAYTLEARAEQQAVAYDLRGREGRAQMEGPHDTVNMRAASGGSSRSYVQQDYTVRRITPVEAERLQGFPDGWTDIRPKGKDTPDGPRYKALGNSMAVPVMRWIIERIDAQMQVIIKGKGQ